MQPSLLRRASAGLVGTYGQRLGTKPSPMFIRLIAEIENALNSVVALHDMLRGGPGSTCRMCAAFPSASRFCRTKTPALRICET